MSGRRPTKHVRLPVGRESTLAALSRDCVLFGCAVVVWCCLVVVVVVVAVVVVVVVCFVVFVVTQSTQ